jgi:hypothetical protein
MIAGMHPWLRYFAVLFLCGGMYLGFVSAQPDDSKTSPPQKLWRLPKPLETNQAPASVEELREIEKHVQKVLQKVMPSVVGLVVGPGQGSGVIVTEDGIILTAGHVSGTPDKSAKVILTTGTPYLDGKTLGKNGGIDSGMIKITKQAKYPCAEMGHSADLKVGQWVIAIGHPGGFRKNRTPVVRVGRILVANQYVIRTDCTLVGGDSGGPLFDMQGRVVGIHSRIGGKEISENMHVPIDTYRQYWTKLASGDSFGGQLGQIPTVLSLAGKIVFEKKDKLAKQDSTEPAGDDKTKDAYRKIYKFHMKAGHTYTLDLVSGDKTGEKLDTFLRLENPAGKELAHDDDGGGFPHARIVYRAPDDGDYRIIATSFKPNQTGRFQLTVRDADFHAGRVEVFKAVNLSPPSVQKVLQEFGKSKLHLQIQALLVDDKGAPLPGKEVTVKWDQGKETIKSNLEGFVRWPLKKDKAKKLSLELPNGVRAAILLTDQDGNNILLKDLLETVKSAGGKIVKTFDGALSKTDPFDLEREKCYRQLHEFKMQAGKTYTLDLVSEDFDAYLRIETDEKGILKEDDDGGGFNNARIVFTPEADGVYRLVVTSCDSGDFGAYRLTIRETNVKPGEPKKDQLK